MEAILILSKRVVAFTYLRIDVYLDIYVHFVENQCVKKKKIKRNCKKDSSTNENQNTLFLDIYCFSCEGAALEVLMCVCVYAYKLKF